MHEYSVMKQLVAALEEELKLHDVDRVTEVHLEIGELTFLGREQLEFAYQVIIKGTSLEGSQLKMTFVCPEVGCEACGYKGPVEYVEDPGFHYNIPIISCPKCGERPVLLKGKETKIVGVTALKEE